MKAELKLSLAMLIYGSIGIFVSNIDLPSTHVVFARAFIASLALIAFCLIRDKGKITKISAKAVVSLLILGGLIGLNWLLLFEAYKYVSVSIATVIYYLEPAFMIILSRVFLKEKLTWPKTVGVCAAIIGMCLINGLAIAGDNPIKGFIYALGSAVAYTVIIFLNKALKYLDEIDGVLTTTYQMIGAAVTMGIYVAFAGFDAYRGMDARSMVLLAILALVHTAFSYCLHFSAIPDLSAQTMGVLSYIDPLSALIFAAVFLNERLGLWQIVGAVLILGGAVVGQTVKAKKTADE